MTAVKICGLCRAEDAALAADAGADYVGVILSPGFGRSRSVAEAAAIFAAAGGSARVGVFVDAGRDVVLGAAVRLGLDVVQLHGTEPPAEAGALRAGGRWQVWKALRPRTRDELLDGAAAYADVVDAILVDGFGGGAVGGTGARAPWDEVAAAARRFPARLRLVLAGGLGPGNVADAIERVRPAVVDVSSGVERVVGEKSAEKVRAFIAEARRAGGTTMRDTTSDTAE